MCLSRARWRGVVMRAQRVSRENKVRCMHAKAQRAEVPQGVVCRGYQVWRLEHTGWA